MGFDCEQCHATPESVTTEGHLFDRTPGRVEVTFDSGLSPNGEYDAGSRTCSALYCHGDGQSDNGTIQADARPRGCGDCHASVTSGPNGWPMLSAAHATHLQEGITCRSCHAQVVGDAGAGQDPEVIDPGRHINGRPDVMVDEEGIAVVGFGWSVAGRCDGVCHSETHSNRGWAASHHPPGWAAPERHGQAAKLNEKTDPSGGKSCNDVRCHGEELRGGASGVLGCDNCHDGGHAPGWRTDCTYCHGGAESPDGAPPRDIDGALTRTSYPPHTSHVSTGDHHGAYDCAECHLTPTDATSPGHMFDETPGKAEVDFRAGLSAGGSWTGQQCNQLYCHGNGRGSNGTVQVTARSIPCTGCHANQSSSEAGWRQLSGQHRKHINERLACSECHGQVVSSTLSGGNPTIVDAQLHVDGVLQLQLPVGMSRTNGRCAGRCHNEGHESERW